MIIETIIWLVMLVFGGASLLSGTTQGVSGEGPVFIRDARRFYGGLIIIVLAFVILFAGGIIG